MRVLLLTGLLSVALALAGALPALAGPWPREKGKFFVSVSAEGHVDTEDLLLLPEYEGTLYAEYGLGRRLTFGADLYRGASSEAYLFFLRRTFTRPEARHQFAGRVGVGRRRDGDTAGGLGLLGASWGMGFESRWGRGWTTVEGQFRPRGTGGQEIKLDSTIGLWPTDNWAAILQLQASDYPGAETTARLQASVVRRLGKRFSVETGLVYGVVNDSRAGLKFGLWSEF